MSGSLQSHLNNSGFKLQPIDKNNAASYDSSIPLVLPNDHEYDLKTKSITKKDGVQRTNLYLVPEALQLLSSITSPLAILSICGPMRTGKSYILSRYVLWPKSGPTIDIGNITKDNFSSEVYEDKFKAKRICVLNLLLFYDSLCLFSYACTAPMSMLLTHFRFSLCLCR